MARTLDPRSIGLKVAAAHEEALAQRARPEGAARLAAIHAALARRRAAREVSSLRRAIGAGIALGAVAASALLWPRGEPLRFSVGQPPGPGVVGVWVAAPAAAPTPIGFSDGTRIVVGQGSRARIASVSEHGARVVVERGEVRADVVPRPGNEWSVVAGPFEIQVTGTSFDAHWDPNREELRVTMHHGGVIVRGPCLPGGRPLGGSEAATLSCSPLPRAAVETAAPAPLQPNVPGAPAPVEEGGAPGPSTARSRLGAPAKLGDGPWPSAKLGDNPSAPAKLGDTLGPPGSGPRPSIPLEREPAAAPGAPSVDTPPGWRELARRNEYRQALAAAEAAGFGHLCDDLPEADLMALGATARLGGGSARAVEAYLAVRRRFSGGDAAATAAFHLGQAAFDGRGAFSEARRWFLVYLAERPGGALAAEALGRVMEAEERLGELDTARATAERYLARHPRGAHAELAKRLSQGSAAADGGSAGTSSALPRP
jgi:hypothetical protein